MQRESKNANSEATERISHGTEEGGTGPHNESQPSWSRPDSSEGTQIRLGFNTPAESRKVSNTGESLWVKGNSSAAAGSDSPVFSCHLPLWYFGKLSTRSSSRSCSRLLPLSTLREAGALEVQWSQLFARRSFWNSICRENRGIFALDGSKAPANEALAAGKAWQVPPGRKASQSRGRKGDSHYPEVLSDFFIALITK